jgi:hypothetical protein
MSRREKRKLGKAERQALRQHRETKELDQIVKNTTGNFRSSFETGRDSAAECRDRLDDLRLSLDFRRLTHEIWNGRPGANDLVSAMADLITRTRPLRCHRAAPPPVRRPGAGALVRHPQRGPGPGSSHPEATIRSPAGLNAPSTRPSNSYASSPPFTARWRRAHRRAIHTVLGLHLPHSHDPLTRRPGRHGGTP